MSRSKIKPYAKDKSGHSWYNRLFRRVNKQRILKGKEPKLMNEVANKYDVCDFVFYVDDDDKYTRK